MPPKKSSKAPSSGSEHLNGIVVQLYHDMGAAEEARRLYVADFDRTCTAEELCLLAAKKLNISPVSFHLFALVDPSLHNWQPPNTEIQCNSTTQTCFVFRMRLIPPVGPGLLSKRFDRAAFDYFYLQCRDDFVNERICYRERKQDKILGLGVVDMVRHAKEHDMTLAELKKLDPTLFIPSNISRRSFKLEEIFTKKKLKINIEPHLDIEWKDFKGIHGVPVLKLRYLVEIKSLSLDFATYIFETESKEQLFLDPHNARFPGICINRGMTGETYFASMEDLADISVNNANVQINRKTGSTRFFQMRSSEDALSLVSLLDGYYRMMVDYHQHLCGSVHSPIIKLLLSIRSHGPVRTNWALKRLEKKHAENSNFNYLLKQKRDSFDTYRLFVWGRHSSWRDPFNIHRLQDGHFQLEKKDEPVFDSIQELIGYYKSGKHPTIKLNDGVRPTPPVDSWLYLCSVESSEDDLHLMTDNQHQQQKSKVSLVSDVTIMQSNIGQGDFTEVHHGMLDKENGVQKVAMKQLSNRYSSTLLEDFMDSIHQASFWSNSATIVTIHALCLAPTFRVLMEYAELGSLDIYLQKPRRNLKVFHLLTVAEQLAQALLYLQEETMTSGEGEVHGNLRCRNVLVFSQDQNGLRVKLGDPGLVHRYNREPVDHWVNLERLAWVAPECYADLHNMTVFSDRYAFGVLLWEVFSSGDHPFGGYSMNNLQDQIQAVKKDAGGIQLDCPSQAPREVYQIMQECWDHTPENRKSPRNMVRDIRSMLHSAPSNNEYHYPMAMNTSSGAFMKMLEMSTQEQRQLMELLNRDVQPPPMPVRTPLSNSLLSLARQPSVDLSVDSRSPLLPRTDSGSAASCVVNPASPILGSASGSVLTQTSLLSDVTDLGAAAAPHSEVGGHEMAPTLARRPLPALPQVHIQGLVSRDLLEQAPGNALLGKGYYGQVHRAILRDPFTNSKREVAVKSLRNHPESDVVEFEKEFKMMSQLEHPHIVKLIGQCSPGLNVPMLLVMEYVEKGCLKEHLNQYKSQLKAVPSTLLNYVQEIAEGMKYLSSKSIIHRDLAARNVLVTKDEHMKISDFGLSRILDPDHSYYKANPEKQIPARWCAPECLQTFKFSVLSDVWSFGVTTWEVYSLGAQPFLCEKFEDIVGVLHKGKRLPQPGICPATVYTVMKHCWEFEPSERFTFDKICVAIKAIKDKQP